jgi:hypothetical protein
MFSECPAKFHAYKVLKLVPFTSTPATEFGVRAHKALENYIKARTPLPAEFLPYSWVCDLLDLIPDAKAEHEFSFSRDGQRVGAKDWKNKGWMGLADVLDITGTHALCVDFKSGGSKYPDIEQLELMFCFTCLDFPEVQSFAGLLLFLQDGVTYPTDGSANWTRAADFDRLWAKWQGKAAMVDEHIRLGAWPARPNNLCNWCQHTTCQHHAPAAAKHAAKQARFNPK